MNGGRNIQLIVQFNSKLLEGFELFQKKKKRLGSYLHYFASFNKVLYNLSI